MCNAGGRYRYPVVSDRLAHAGPKDDVGEYQVGNGRSPARFTISPQGPYSLATSAAFLEGFTPAAYQAVPEGHVHLAFTVAETEFVAGVCLTQREERVTIDVFGVADPRAARNQVVRMLSLDLDASGFAAVGQRDPAIEIVQQRLPGFRPVLFHSPYEAAAWALIGHRIRITQAAKVKARIARELGPSVDIHGDRRHAFPAPSRLAELTEIPGLPARKVEYLRVLAVASRAGELDAARLRVTPWDQAMASLMELPGIGPFSAELILLRGAGIVDQLPTHEQRFPRAVALAYDLPAVPTSDEIEAISSSWRPFRTWVAVLLRTILEEGTGEIRGRPSTSPP